MMKVLIKSSNLTESSIKMSKLKIYWTLRNNCPADWIEKFKSKNITFTHDPIISLKVNQNIDTLSKSIRAYDTLIITSQFAAKKFNSISNKSKVFDIFVVGEKSASILNKSNQNILYISENINDLVKYIHESFNKKAIHLCSTKSNNRLLPKNIDIFKFYSPIENANFQINNDNFDKNSILVFGSPSAVDVWFKKSIDISDSSIAAIGKTTAQQIKYYTTNPLIVPSFSRVENLCESIFNYLNK